MQRRSLPPPVFGEMYSVFVQTFACLRSSKDRFSAFLKTLKGIFCETTLFSVQAKTIICKALRRKDQSGLRTPSARNHASPNFSVFVAKSGASARGSGASI